MYISELLKSNMVNTLGFRKPTTDMVRRISPQADIKGFLRIREDITIHAAFISSRCVINSGVIICRGAYIGDELTIEPDVIVHERAAVFSGCEIGYGAELHQSSAVNCGIAIHPRANIGPGIVVPAQDTIMVIAGLATIAGGVGGPFFGTEIGESTDWNGLWQHVETARCRGEHEAEYYRDLKPVLEMCGEIVQRRFDAQTDLAAEVRANADELTSCL